MAEIIIVGNLKGGSGKTTIAMILASYLSHKKKKEILVLDSDTLQSSFKSSKERSIQYGEDDKFMYEVLLVTPKQIPQKIRDFYDDYDYIFLDLPGNLGEVGVLDSYILADYLIVPTSCTEKDLSSTSKFLEQIFKNVLPIRKKEGYDTKIIGCINRVNVKGLNYKSFKEELDSGNIPIPFFKEVIPFSEVLESQVDVSYTVTYINKNFHIGKLYKEFDKFLELD